MNAQSIIEELSLSRDERQIYSMLAKLFDEYTPTTLYMDYYELANGIKNIMGGYDFEGFKGTTPEQWERFLDIPEIYRYRTGKIAKLQEFAAIKAMKSLEAQGQSASAGAVSALKEITKLSSQLNSNNQNRQKIILTYVKPKSREVQA